MESTWLGRKSTTQVLCEKVKQLESDLATAEQDSRQKQARIARLEAAVRELRKSLDQLANGYHLDAIPNHDDDSLVSVANRVGHTWIGSVLRRHAVHVNEALRNTEDA